MILRIALAAAIFFLPALVLGQQPSTPPGPASAALFEDLPIVEAASLHTQALNWAPANVSIVTADDIRRYGYRTLAEALAGVRGIYTTYDHHYYYAGLRGFSLPGDYNTRFLVMLNGHPLTDNIYDSSGYFGQDLGVDMDLVSRIEIVRGPTSALYGSNGIYATVNIVTRSPVESDRLRVDAEIAGFGEKKLAVASALDLGRGANLLLAGSVFNNGGETLRFPGLDPAADVDGERGYHAFANLVWRNWNFTAYVNDRLKDAPLSWAEDAAWFHRGNHIRDSRNFVRAVYSRPVRGSGLLRWEAAYDWYRYYDRFDYPLESGFEDHRSYGVGDWLNTQGSYEYRVPRLGVLTAGAQLNLDLRNLQYDEIVSPQRWRGPEISHPNFLQALFVEQEVELGKRFVFHLGLRLDHSRHFGFFLSPRLAMVHQPSPRATIKFVFGRPFRNPNPYERFFYDGITFLANPDLRPEIARTYDLSYERKLGDSYSLTVAAYRYKLDGIIATAYLDDGFEQFQNLGGSRSTGVETEFAARPGRRFEAAASLAFQRSISLPGSVPLVNSPRWLGQARFAIPLFKDRLTASSSLQYMSRRSTLSGDAVRSAFLAGVTFSTLRLHPHYDLAFGVRNLANWHYEDPIGLILDRMPQPGRSFFLKLIWRVRE